MITLEMLKSWSPCIEGYKRFCELFPHGADLKTAADGLSDDGHNEWAIWLFEQCRERKLFEDITIKGHQNTGYQNTGDRNTGHRNTGDRNTGHRNTGHRNTGDWNTGDWNTGYHNTGHRNTGYHNTGHQNTGDWNTGYHNTGYHNTGEQNTGDRNTGDWNTGDWNTGFFNTKTPEDILAFNKPVLRSAWEDSYKPSFLFFDITYWVPESEMTEAEKANDPDFYIRGGQLRKKDYKIAFKESWDKADKRDRERVRELPNFDAQVFFEISGIDLR